MADCRDCLSNCDPLITDKCVKYTGEDYNTLGVEKGDSVFEVEKVILDKLIEIEDGSGIEPDVELCGYVETQLDGEDPTLNNVLKALSDGECDLDSRLIAVEAEVNAPYSFNTKCLTGSLTTRDEILQATIDNTCDVDTRLTVVENDYVKQSDLCTQVSACLASSSVQYKDRMVPYAPILYIGSLSNFDNTGKGLTSAGFDKVYLLNGLNGTPDWRGRSPIGAIQNVPGTTLDSAVDPALPANTAYNYSLGTKKGASSDTLSVLQTPAHTHGVIDPTHSHGIRANTNGSGNSSDASRILPPTGAPPPPIYTSEPALTGISIGATGGGQSHNTTHPVIGTYYIVYIP